MRNNLVSKMCLTALFTAIAYVLTAFAAIPYADGGFFNLGDIVTLVASVIIGPWYGVFVGTVAGSMADISFNALFIPFTIVAKGSMALLAGYLYPRCNKFIKPLILLSSTLLMVITYFFAYLILFGAGALISSAFDLAQAGVATVGSYLVLTLCHKYVRFDKFKEVKEQ